MFSFTRPWRCKNRNNERKLLSGHKTKRPASCIQWNAVSAGSGGEHPSSDFCRFTLIIVNEDRLTNLDATLLASRIENCRHQSANEGIGASLNRGLQLCQSEYVARMDADDISLANRFKYQVEYLDAHPDVVMLGTQIEFLIGNRRSACTTSAS